MIKIPPESNIQKLKTAKSLLADVYEAEAVDDLFDNGNLGHINAAVLEIEHSIYILSTRT